MTSKIWKLGMWRTPCSVPHCGRTIKRIHEYEYFLCGKHFRLADKRLLSRLRKVRRLAKRRNLLNTMRFQMLDDKIWQMIKEQAIERGCGL